MSHVELVAEHWAWSGLEPVELVVENDFGNLILKDEENRFWRLCPEDVYCSVVAESIDAYNKLIQDSEFLEDWHMIAMVTEAKKRLGELAPDQKYCLLVPGILGGDYIGSNVVKAPLGSIIESAGRLGRHVGELADGAKINLSDVDYLTDLE